MRVNIGFPVVRTDGRAYGHVITKFSRMGRLPHFLSYGAPSTRARFARGWSSAITWFATTVKGTFGVNADGVVATIVRAGLAFVYI